MGALFWGWVSDVIGRRPVMLLGLCGTVSMELLFGFSQNFGWAVAARFLWGLLNGNIGVGKTYISEVRCLHCACVGAVILLGEHFPPSPLKNIYPPLDIYM